MGTILCQYPVQQKHSVDSPSECFYGFTNMANISNQQDMLRDLAVPKINTNKGQYIAV